MHYICAQGLLRFIGNSRLYANITELGNVLYFFHWKNRCNYWFFLLIFLTSAVPSHLWIAFIAITGYSYVETGSPTHSSPWRYSAWSNLLFSFLRGGWIFFSFSLSILIQKCRIISVWRRQNQKKKKEIKEISLFALDTYIILKLE